MHGHPALGSVQRLHRAGATDARDARPLRDEAVDRGLCLEAGYGRVSGDGTLTIRPELPGIDPGVDIEVEGNLLRISGEKRVERETSDKDRFLRECRYGSYRREVVLPDGVDPDAIVADFDNGVLTVRVPLPTEVAEDTPEKEVAMAVPQQV